MVVLENEQFSTQFDWSNENESSDQMWMAIYQKSPIFYWRKVENKICKDENNVHLIPVLLQTLKGQEHY